MSETPIPAKIMVEVFTKAHDEYEWEKGVPIEEFSKRRDIYAIRAALRALAAMEPTERMDESCQNEMDNENLDCAWDVARAGILAAAEEGEAKP